MLRPVGQVGLSLTAFSERLRALPEGRGEGAAEVSRGAEAASVGDFGDAQGGVGGETLRLAPEFLSGDVTFACYDGDRVSYKPNPANRWNKLVEYKNDSATITADGILTAKAPGTVMVVIRTANLEKEIIPVCVA